MDFKQLEAFVSTIDCNSFSEAARRLYLTQPTISAHINSLESELNTKLLNRTTKKMELTVRGAQFYEFASSVLNMRDTIVKEFTGDGTKFINLGASTIPSTYILPDVLAPFCEAVPDVEFQIWQADSKKVISRVEEGTLDFGLTGTTIDSDNCAFIPFCTDTLTVVAPNNSHFQKLKRNNVPITELFKEPIIMRESGSGTQKEMEAYLLANKIDITKLNCVLHINDLEGLKRMVAGGTGLSIVSRRSVMNLIENESVLEFPLTGEKTTRNLYIVYNKNKILKPHVNQLIRFIRSFYAKEAPVLNHLD